MKVLVIGGGGREHALAWKISQSPRVDRVFVAPGNAGTAEDAENVEISPSDFAGLVQFARQNQIGLAVVGPERPWRRASSTLQREGLRAFGPTRAAARLKPARSSAATSCAADVPRRLSNIQNAGDAVRFLNEREDSPIVVKADGLAAGKGDRLWQSRAGDRRGQRDRPRKFARRATGWIEERLVYEEASVLAIPTGGRS